MLKRLWKTASLEKVLGCDLRSLALLRVFISVILLLDWINRLQNFRAFHSEVGLFPRAALLELYGNPYIWSLNHISTGEWWQATLLGINLICILCLLVGWRTRMFTFFCWILQLSLQAKNPILMQSGDVQLRLILFWAMFLPWGAQYSIDSALYPLSKPQRVFSYATMALCLQTIYVYFFAALLKTGPQWRVDGTAAYYALNIDHFSTPLGKALLGLPIWLLKISNFAVLGFELIGPLLLLIPWGHRWFRPLLILAFWGMHIGFGASLAIGNFVLISIASTIPFIPTETWDFISKRLIKAPGGKGYYDEDCGFCIKMVAIVGEFLVLPKTFFATAQSDANIEKLMLKENSWVYKNQQGQTFVRFRAMAEVVAESSLFFWFKWLAKIPGVHLIGDMGYKWVSKNRSIVCHPKAALISPAFSLKPIENLFLGFVLVFITLWNVGTLPRPLTTIAQKFEPFALLLRLEQKWEMFAPFPMTDDGWFVIKSKLRSGNEVDLFRNGQPVTFEKPASVKDMYPDFRWRKYMVNLWAASFSPYRQYYSKYLCRSWNRTHPYLENVVSFDIIYMKEDTPPPGTPLPVAVPTSIWTWNCF